jgi:hypothetical protein
MAEITSSSRGYSPHMSLNFLSIESDEPILSDNDDEEIRKNSIALIHDLIEGWPKTRCIWNLLNQDPELCAHWVCANYITVHKLGMNDHGRVHAMVATSSALQIFDILMDVGIEPDIISSGMGEMDDAYLIVLTAALCHDIGNEIHRIDHVFHSLLI